MPTREGSVPPLPQLAPSIYLTPVAAATVIFYFDSENMPATLTGELHGPCHRGIASRHQLLSAAPSSSCRLFPVIAFGRTSPPASPYESAWLARTVARRHRPATYARAAACCDPRVRRPPVYQPGTSAHLPSVGRATCGKEAPRPAILSPTPAAAPAAI
jgi:hypothetical protein